MINRFTMTALAIIMLGALLRIWLNTLSTTATAPIVPTSALTVQSAPTTPTPAASSAAVPSAVVPIGTTDLSKTWKALDLVSFYQNDLDGFQEMFDKVLTVSGKVGLVSSWKDNRGYVTGMDIHLKGHSGTDIWLRMKEAYIREAGRLQTGMHITVRGKCTRISLFDDIMFYEVSLQ